MTSIGCGQFSDNDWMDYMVDQKQHSPLARHVHHCPVCSRVHHNFLNTMHSVHDSLQQDALTQTSFVNGVIADSHQKQNVYNKKWFRPQWSVYNSVAVAFSLIILAFGITTLLITDQPLADKQSNPIYVSSFHAVLEEDGVTTGELFAPHGVTRLTADTTSVPLDTSSKYVTTPHGTTTFIAE